ncbi:MAG: c(7)-type cytochrome triheme domain-containing protein [Thermodesulfobacteriota bacterium]
MPRVRAYPFRWGVVILMAVVAVFTVSARLNAEDSDFRKKFTKFYQANNFFVLGQLVKQSKDIIPGEVETLVGEATAEGVSVPEKLYLLDMARTMASMYKDWHGEGEDLLKKVEALQKVEVDKKKAREAEVQKWKDEEKTPGNFVMKAHAEELEAAGLSPVLYPHWVHRMFFRCKVCHEKIFTMKRGSNDLSQEKIAAGEQCGTCHNGELSFSATDEANCKRCHLAGTEEAAPLHDFTRFDHDGLKEISERVGSMWDPGKLPEGKYPVDKFNFVNWVKMDSTGAFKPKDSLDDADTEAAEVRESYILFKSPITFMKDVLFSHKIHTTWIRCNICHDRIFTKEVGANKVTMIEIKEGKACGTCHGRVSFPIGDCLRCHNHEGEVPEGTHVRAKSSSEMQPAVAAPAAPTAP